MSSSGKSSSKRQANFKYSRLSFANPDSAEVELLAKCCEPATFGLNKEDVYDETYRKAGKLDIDSFAMNIDLARLELVEEISSRLLAQERPFRAELYKLNVYGTVQSFVRFHSFQQC